MDNTPMSLKIYKTFNGIRTIILPLLLKKSLMHNNCLVKKKNHDNNKKENIFSNMGRVVL